jgi:hypothetical protein
MERRQRVGVPSVEDAVPVSVPDSSPKRVPPKVSRDRAILSPPM